MKQFSKITFILILCCVSFNLDAQIKYTQGRLNINEAAPNPNYELTINKWRGLHWTAGDGGFLLLDLFIASPAIAGHTDQIAFYNPDTFKFNSILVSDVYNLSDSRSKKDIEPLENCMSDILRLRPVSYRWKISDLPSERISYGSNIDKSTELMIPKLGSSSDKETQFGFIAQEVEEVFPEAVKTLEDGTKLVNYNALIPILVEAVQSLQKTVESQSALISQLSDKIAVNNKVTNSYIICNPNPVQDYININYSIDIPFNNALIRISDLTGTIKKEIKLTTESDTKTDNISIFNKGIYVIGLYADGCLLATTRIIKE